MSRFKEQLLKDQATFFNTDEFGSLHHINGLEIPIIIDEDLLDERNRSLSEGTFSGELLFFVEKCHFQTRPEVDDRLSIDGKKYFIQTCTETGLYYEIVVARNDSSYC